MLRRIILFAVLAAASLITASAAGAATLEADYQFQDTRASSVAGPPSLTDLGTGNAFTTETVGSCPARVLTFPEGNGLSVSASEKVDYSVVILARVNAVDSYRKLFDYKDGTADEGLYLHDGGLDWFDPIGEDREGPAAVVGPGAYAEIAFTVLLSPPNFDKRVTGYVNGEQQFDVVPLGGFPLIQTALRFFIDDEGTGDEETGGAVSRIRIYDGALTASEVAAIHGGSIQPPVCQPPPASPASSSTPTNTGERAAALKKCKKKAKKKHWTKKQLKKCKKKANLLPV